MGVLPSLSAGGAARMAVRSKSAGHRVYKLWDPRACVIYRVAQLAIEQAGVKSEALVKVACALESSALLDSYFVSHRRYLNVDFYSRIAHRAMGFPNDRLY